MEGGGGGGEGTGGGEGAGLINDSWPARGRAMGEGAANGDHRRRADEGREGGAARTLTEADFRILQAERLRAEIRYESRRFTLQILLALALAFGVGYLAGRFWR